MRIEEAIQQTKPFKSAYQKVMVNLMFTSNWLEEHLRNILRPYDITIQQYNVLRILRGANKALTTSVIRRKLIDKMSDTSRMVDRLCKKGLVHRAQCCGDRRKVDILLTQAGHDLLAEIDRDTPEFDACVSALSPQEAILLSDLLDKMRTNSKTDNE
jgi:DNA-binding MarR family transcriptional regulator